MPRKLKLFFSLAAGLVMLIGCGPHNQRLTANPIDAVAGDRPFRVMTFNMLNIYVGQGIESPWATSDKDKISEESLENVIEAIRSADPDVVGLQDIVGPSQTRTIADALDLNYAYVDHGDPKYSLGMALLSKYEILSTTKIPIHPASQRQAMIAKIDVAGRAVQVMNVHFHKVGYEEQVERTLATIRALSGPVILLGDLNLRPMDDQLAPITAAFIDTCTAVDTAGSAEAESVGTYPRQAWRIDYVFVDGGHFRVVDAGIVAAPYRYAADHIAYFADVALKK